MKTFAMVAVIVVVAVVALAVGWYAGRGPGMMYGRHDDTDRGYDRMDGRGMMDSGMMGGGRWSGGQMYDMMNAMHRDYSRAEYDSNGQKIFLIGVDMGGHRLAATNMPGMGRMGMMQMGCANCHGPDGKGSQFTFPDGTRAPDIRWSTLSKPMKMHGETEPAYAEQTLKRAITKGIGSDGDELATWMPRWEISGRDLDDLVAYLKTL